MNFIRKSKHVNKIFYASSSVNNYLVSSKFPPRADTCTMINPQSVNQKAKWQFLYLALSQTHANVNESFPVGVLYVENDLSPWIFLLKMIWFHQFLYWYKCHGKGTKCEWKFPVGVPVLKLILFYSNFQTHVNVIIKWPHVIGDFLWGSCL